MLHKFVLRELIVNWQLDPLRALHHVRVGFFADLDFLFHLLQSQGIMIPGLAL
jgi:hypothetical protein